MTNSGHPSGPGWSATTSLGHFEGLTKPFNRYETSSFVTARPSFDSPSFNSEDMQCMHTGQVPLQANTAGPSCPANKPRKLTAHEQRVGDLVVGCSLDNTSKQQHHHHCHFHHRTRCFTSIDIPAHYSCGTGYCPSIGLLGWSSPRPLLHQH